MYLIKIVWSLHDQEGYTHVPKTHSKERSEKKQKYKKKQRNNRRELNEKKWRTEISRLLVLYYTQGLKPLPQECKAQEIPQMAQRRVRKRRGSAEMFSERRFQCYRFKFLEKERRLRRTFLVGSDWWIPPKRPLWKERKQKENHKRR